MDGWVDWWMDEWMGRWMGVHLFLKRKKTTSAVI